MSMQGCKIGPIMAISWQREKKEAIFKWKLWIWRLLQSEAKNLCQTPEIMDSAVSSSQGFSSLHGLCFWRIGLRFLIETFLFSLVHIITAAASFSVCQAGERCSKGWDFAKICSSAMHTVLLQVCLGIPYLFPHNWFYAPTLVYILNFFFQVCAQ